MVHLVVERGGTVADWTVEMGRGRDRFLEDMPEGLSFVLEVFGLVVGVEMSDGSVAAASRASSMMFCHCMVGSP